MYYIIQVGCLWLLMSVQVQYKYKHIVLALLVSKSTLFSLTGVCL